MYALEKEMAIHSSVLAWRIPEPGGLPSTGSHRVRHDLAAAAATVFLNKQYTVFPSSKQTKNMLLVMSLII